MIGYKKVMSRVRGNVGPKAERSELRGLGGLAPNSYSSYRLAATAATGSQLQQLQARSYSSYRLAVTAATGLLLQACSYRNVGPKAKRSEIRGLGGLAPKIDVFTGFFRPFYEPFTSCIVR